MHKKFQDQNKFNLQTAEKKCHQEVGSIFQVTRVTEHERINSV